MREFGFIELISKKLSLVYAINKLDCIAKLLCFIVKCIYIMNFIFVEHHLFHYHFFFFLLILLIWLFAKVWFLMQQKLTMFLRNFWLTRVFSYNLLTFLFLCEWRCVCIVYRNLRSNYSCKWEQEVLVTKFGFYLFFWGKILRILIFENTFQIIKLKNSRKT